MRQRQGKNVSDRGRLAGPAGDWTSIGVRTYEGGCSYQRREDGVEGVSGFGCERRSR